MTNYNWYIKDDKYEYIKPDILYDMKILWDLHTKNTNDKNFIINNKYKRDKYISYCLNIKDKNNLIKQIKKNYLHYLVSVKKPSYLEDVVLNINNQKDIIAKYVSRYINYASCNYNCLGYNILNHITPIFSVDSNMKCNDAIYIKLMKEILKTKNKIDLFYRTDYYRVKKNYNSITIFKNLFYPTLLNLDTGEIEDFTMDNFEKILCSKTIMEDLDIYKYLYMTLFKLNEIYLPTEENKIE